MLNGNGTAPKVIVVGGSLGGLFNAIALRSLGFEVSRHMVNRRPGVENHTLVWANQLRTGPANGFLLGKLVRIPRRKGEFIGCGVEDPRTSMSSLDTPGSL